MHKRLFKGYVRLASAMPLHAACALCKADDREKPEFKWLRTTGVRWETALRKAVSSMQDHPLDGILKELARNIS